MDAGLLSGEGTDLTVVHFSLEFHLAKERPGIFIQKQYVGEKTTEIVYFGVNQKESHFF